MDAGIMPERTALINVDLQNGFVLGAPAGLAILSRVNRFAAVCRRNGILVVHTAHVLEPDGSNLGVLAMVPKIKAGFLNRGSESAALHPDLRVEAKDVVLEKPRFGAFHGTDLEKILRSRGIDTIVITGISTPVCCDTTAREANARDFRVFVVSDATASTGSDTTDADRWHRAALDVLDGLFATVVTTNELVAQITGTAEAQA